ncbi:hypothetical protein BMS3Abin04_02675 [bacterium BMS3Abin04]|nr:hypothetical protein BMS3Abin04_02675 [bacterium BMS3Abin04]
MLKRNIVFVMSFSLAMILLPSNNYAQFEINKNYAGPVIGLAFLGSTVQFGANYEYGMELKDLPGKIGVGGLFRYWGYHENFAHGNWSYTNILVGAQGNYHFKISGGKYDPFFGLVLAFDIGSVSWSGEEKYRFAEPSHGGFFLGAHAGARYWFSPNMAVLALVNFGTLGYGGLDIGLDFKF